MSEAVEAPVVPRFKSTSRDLGTRLKSTSEKMGSTDPSTERTEAAEGFICLVEGWEVSLGLETVIVETTAPGSVSVGLGMRVVRRFQRRGTVDGPNEASATSECMDVREE